MRHQFPCEEKDVNSINRIMCHTDTDIKEASCEI